MRRLFILVLAVIILLWSIQSAVAFGVSPARKNVDFSSTLKGTIRIINSQGEALSLVVAPKGTLSSYVTLSQNVIEMNSSEYEKDITYTIQAPEGALSPGPNTVDFMIVSVSAPTANGNNKISANAGIISQLIINRPYSGKEIKARIDYNSNTNTVIVPVFSLGTENIQSVKADVAVLGPTNAIVETKSSDAMPLTAKGTIELPVQLGSLNSGNYDVKAQISYDGKVMTLEQVINVGKPLVVIDSIEFPNFVYGGINKVEINARNEWNQESTGVYGLVEFYSSDGTLVEKVKTPTENIPAFGKTTLDSYWDTSNYPLGEYNVKAILYSGSNQQEKSMKVTLTGKDIIYNNAAAGKATSQGSNIALLALGVALLVIINLVLLFVILRKKKK